MDHVTSALIALGSNLSWGQRPPARIVAGAMRDLGRLGAVSAASRLWRSPAWPPGGPAYVNAAVALDTALPPDGLLAALHALEAAWGRTRGARWGPRTLDLDLVAMGDLVRPDAATQAAWAGRGLTALPPDAPAGLVLPHPGVQDRGFVLAPLAEVAPGWRHPLLGLTVRAMLDRLPPGRLDGVGPLDGAGGAGGAGADGADGADGAGALAIPPPAR